MVFFMLINAGGGQRAYFLPPNVKRTDIYHANWIDFNKNGQMDPYENPNLPVEGRVEDLLKRMTLEEKIHQLQSGGRFACW